MITALLLILACSSSSSTPTAVGITDVVALPHATVATLIVVSWAQDNDSDDTWLEFEVDGEWRRSPPQARFAGAHSELILGVPADTDVSFRVVAQIADQQSASDDALARTAPLPDGLYTPTIAAWDPDLASAAPYVLGSVDVSATFTYGGPWWVFIADRQGRIVWYQDLSPDMSMFPRVARDGTHIAMGVHSLLDGTSADAELRRTTLDGSWTDQTPVPGLGWAWDETDDGTVLYDSVYPAGSATLQAVSADGATRTVWDCVAYQATWDDDHENCYTNAVNWDPTTDTVLWSTYWGDTIYQVDHSSGQVLWHAGSLPDGLPISPSDAGLDLQHYPNWTPDGTLLVSTHVPGLEEETQRANEYRVDDEGLTRIWSYGQGVAGWAQYSGEAVRLDNGNTLVNYGTGGEIREVTSDGETAWSLQFGDGHTLGHTQLIDDLYALNTGR